MVELTASDAKKIRVAIGQFDPQINDRVANRLTMLSMCHQAADEGADLIVFPECALTGYCYESRREALEQSETVPGHSTLEMVSVAADRGIFVVFGLIERSEDKIYNAAVLVGPDGLVGVYRKTHLPFEALDRFVNRGNGPFSVFDTPVGRIGMLICYDMRFPEPARVLALMGADIIVHPTNLPPPGAPQPDFLYQARAVENRIWIVSADRVGTERGVQFIGRSAIVDPLGNKVAVGSDDGVEVILADIEPTTARQKDLIVMANVYELRMFADRRPDLYASIAQPHGIDKS